MQFVDTESLTETPILRAAQTENRQLHPVRTVHRLWCPGVLLTLGARCHRPSHPLLTRFLLEAPSLAGGASNSSVWLVSPCRVCRPSLRGDRTPGCEDSDLEAPGPGGRLPCDTAIRRVENSGPQLHTPLEVAGRHCPTTSLRPRRRMWGWYSQDRTAPGAVELFRVVN